MEGDERSRIGAPVLPGGDEPSFRAQMARLYDGVTLGTIGSASADFSGAGEAQLRE
ncbi:MAG: hypothetical protein ACP5JJ_06725 [Anaerolineae bacterium]